MLVWCNWAAARASRSNRFTCAGSGIAWAARTFERDPPAERLLLGLVDDPHAAASGLAKHPEVAQPLQPRAADDHRRGDAAAGDVKRVQLELSGLRRRRDRPGDSAVHVGVGRRVALDRGL